MCDYLDWATKMIISRTMICAIYCSDNYARTVQACIDELDATSNSTNEQLKMLSEGSQKVAVKGRPRAIEMK
jgi:hypothetical protein